MNKLLSNQTYDILNLLEPQKLVPKSAAFVALSSFFRGEIIQMNFYRLMTLGNHYRSRLPRVHQRLYKQLSGLKFKLILLRIATNTDVFNWNFTFPKTDPNKPNNSQSLDSIVSFNESHLSSPTNHRDNITLPPFAICINMRYTGIPSIKKNHYGNGNPTFTDLSYPIKSRHREQVVVNLAVFTDFDIQATFQ